MRNKNQTLLFFLVLISVGIFSLFVAAPRVFAATEVGGLFDTDQHWVATGSPYVIKKGIPNATFDGFSMASGATLTIDPGVIVKIDEGAQFGAGSGIIKAIGTEDDPIIITALTDDTGGDTNGDGASTTPALGFWNRISVSDDGDHQDEFQFVEIRYGTTCIEITFGSTLVRNARIEHCQTGVKISYDHPAFPAINRPEVATSTIAHNQTGLSLLRFSTEATTTPLSITGNNIFDNSVWGAQNLDPDDPVDVVDISGNWWGDASGPTHATLNPTGIGDKITDGFVLNDFLSVAVATSTATTTPEATGENANNNASGGGGATAAVPPKIISFSATPKQYKEGGGPITLHWQVQNANSVRIEPGGHTAFPSGQLELTPAQPTTYTLTAISSGFQPTQELFVGFAPRDPVIIVPGILGSMRDLVDLLVDRYVFNDGKPTLDPILHTYDGLWEGLRSVGYIPGRTLFDFPYNWRKDNRETAKLLSKRIDQVLQICECQKVDVVAHSMGGLAARYYIQNINPDTIDQLIFLGAPHLGAPKAYLAWEAGEMGNNVQDLVLKTYIELEALSKGYLLPVKYIHEEVRSLAQLLPVFKYLTSFETGEFYEYERCREGLFTCNDFINQLKNVSLNELSNQRFYNLINDNIQTYRTFLIKDRSPLERRKWFHGKPFNYPSNDGILFGPGDQTVPKISSSWGLLDSIYVSASHKDLPYYAQSIVSKILINKEIGSLKGPKLINKILFIGIKSPADIVITDPDGNSFGVGHGGDGLVFYSGTEDPEFITIPNPKDGEYQLELVGTGSGDYEVEVALLGDDLEITKIFQGTVSTGEKHEFTFSHLNELNALSDLDKKDTAPPNTELIINGESAKKSYQTPVVISFNVVDESEMVQTLYSFDSGQTWAVYTDSISLSELGNYELLYRSIDEYGNGEYAKLANFAIVEEINQPPAVAVGQTSDIIGEPATVSNPTSTPIDTGEVLGKIIETENERNQYKGRIIIFVSILILILIIIVLRRKRK